MCESKKKKIRHEEIYREEQGNSAGASCYEADLSAACADMRYVETIFAMPRK